MANPSAVDNINLSGPTVEADHARSIHEGKLNELSKEDLERAVALEQYVPGSVAEKKLVRKIDFVLLPVLWLMYVLAWIDRGNISNASAAGMLEQIGLSDSDYAMVVSIFFIGYILCEVPSNLLLYKIRPSIYLSTIMLVWGTIVAAMSTSKTYGHFLVGRFFLGCIEAGLFPGCLYLLSCWYTKEELGKRFAIFYTSGCISPALGGIMAGAIISGLEGVNGMAGWRWLFLIEGVITVGFSFIFVLVLIDYPSTTRKFFTPEELQLAQIRILSSREVNVAQNNDGLTPLQAVAAVASDPRVYAFLILYMLDQTSASITYFVPVVLKSMGYSSVAAQWMTVPIWISGAVVMVIASFTSDYFQDRRRHIIGCMLTCFVSCIVCLTVTNEKVRYAMLCFYIGGIFAAVSQILNWTSHTFSLPDQKRSVAIAFVNSFGNLSSLWGSRLWPSAQGPTYTMGFATIAGMTGVASILAFSMPYMFKLLPKEPATKAERDLLARQAARGREVESSL